MKRHIQQAVILFLAAAISIAAPAYAQQAKCTVTGKILDENQVPVPFASVAVYMGEKPLIGAVTDDDGKFKLNMLQGSNPLLLTVEFIGYTKHTQSLLPDKYEIHLGAIILKEDAISLEGVVVEAKETAQKSNVEHTTINASANMVSSKGTALDVLRSAAAVSISNDEISIRGNKNILVLIDGVPTTASDLSAISAGNIKSIDVITNPDASHDASGTGGIINIISKKTSAEGFSGMVAANYGFNHFVTANAAFAYNKGKNSYRFSYNTKYEDDKVITSLNRYLKSADYNLNQQMEANRYTYNNNITFGADFKLNSRNRISIDAKCILPRINIEQDLKNTFVENGVQKEEIRYNDVTWNRENIEGSVAYTHVIEPEVSDFTVKGSVSKIWGHRPSCYYLNNEIINRSNSGGSPFITSLQADYKEKLQKGTFTAGAKLTYRRNDIFHEFYQMEGSQWVYSQTMSNDLLHTELVPAAYAMYAGRLNKKFTYKGGLRVEVSTVTLNSSHSDVDQSKTSWFFAPSLQGTYKAAQGKELSFALSRRIGRPSYPQLNPYMSMVDATTYEQGNMFLKPEKATKLDVSYNLAKGPANFFVNGYLSHTDNYISQITAISGNKLITTYVNADTDIKAGVELSFRTEISKKLGISMAANTFYADATGEYNDAEISNSGVTNNSSITLDIFPWKGGSIQCQYFVTTPQYFPQLTTELTQQMNLGYKQKKGAFTFSALLTDVFKSAKWEVYSNNNIFDLTNTSTNKSRMLWLGVSYNFNSFKQKGGQKGESDRQLIKLGL